MMRRIVRVVPLLAIAFLLGVPGRLGAAEDSQKAPGDKQASSNQQQQQSSASATNDQKTSADNQTSSDQQRSSSAKGTSESQSTQTDTQSSATSRDRGEANGPSLPPPAGSEAKSDSNQPQSRSVLKDKDASSQTPTSSRDNATTRYRSDQTNTRTEDRTSKDNTRDQMQRDLRSGIKIGKSTDRGLRVNSVTRSSIFYESGLRNDDVIVSINGRPVRSEAEFNRVVVFEPGRRIPFIVFRNGREQTIYVTFRQEVASRDRDVQRNASAYFGAEFDPQVKDAAVIIRIDEGSPADRAGLRRNDVVVALGGERVSSPKDAMDIIGSTKPGERLDVEYSRQAHTEVALQGGSEREVATRQADDRAGIETTRESSTYDESTAPDARRTNRDRDTNTQDRNRTDRRGILGRRRG